MDFFVKVFVEESRGWDTTLCGRTAEEPLKGRGGTKGTEGERIGTMETQFTKWQNIKLSESPIFGYPLFLQQDFFNSPLCKQKWGTHRYLHGFSALPETNEHICSVLSNMHAKHILSSRACSIQSPFGSAATVKIFKKNMLCWAKILFFFWGAMPISLSCRIQQRTWLKIRIHESWHSPSAGMPLEWTGPRKRA